MPLFAIPDGNRNLDRFNNPTIIRTIPVNNNINRSESAGGGSVPQPYPGTFQVGDLETSDTFSLNQELQKIDNFEASSGSDTNIAGRLRVGETATGRVYDPTIATFIELDGSTVEVSANNLTLNGIPVITTAGSLNLDTTLTTTQISFTNPQQLITKQYVDTGIAELETKTQNISNLTVAGNTVSTGVQRFLLGNDASTKFSINLGLATDPFNFPVMEVKNDAVATYVPLTTQIIRPDFSDIRDIGSSSLKYKDIYANKGIFDQATTNQTVFISDQELVSKKYVDDNSGGGAPFNRRWFSGQTGTLYEDESVRIIWDAVNNQPKFLLIQTPGMGGALDVGFQLNKEGGIAVSNQYITNQANIEFYFYPGAVQSRFSFGRWGTFARGCIVADSDPNYPVYSILFIRGNTNLNVTIDKY
jgi:hypothetical protein